METRYQWSQRLRNVADGSGILTHQFLTTITRPSALRQEMLIAWAHQDYLVSKRFPQLLGLLIAGIEDPMVRHPMVVNMWEEHGDGDPKRSHFSLFQRLLESVGQPVVYSEQVFSRATKDFVELQERLARESILQGLGAFCYANEYITVNEFKPLWAAFDEAYPSSDTEFFAANSEIDVIHAQLTEDVIEALVQDEHDLQDVERGAKSALAARVRFYDQLMSPFKDRREID